MNLKTVLLEINAMKADGIIDRYAIGGAVGATFYLEPVATLDVDIFISFQAQPGSLLISPEPVFKYLTERGALPGIYQRRGGCVDLSSIRGSGLGYRLSEIERTLPPCDVRFGSLAN